MKPLLMISVTSPNVCSIVRVGGNHNNHDYQHQSPPLMCVALLGWVGTTITMTTISLSVTFDSVCNTVGVGGNYNNHGNQPRYQGISPLSITSTSVCSIVGVSGNHNNHGNQPGYQPLISHLHKCL